MPPNDSTKSVTIQDRGAKGYKVVEFVPVTGGVGHVSRRIVPPNPPQNLLILTVFLQPFLN